MANYKLSQTPSKKTKPRGYKKFWAPKRQKQKLNQKNIVTALVIAGIVIVVGAAFAAIRISSQQSTPSKSKLPAIIGGSQIQGSNSHDVTAAEYQAVKNAATDKNAGLLNAYFAAKVRIVIIDIGINETVDAAQAAAIINDGLAVAQNPWNFNVSQSQLTDWQNGPYGKYFSGTVAVGVSANGDVISVGFDDNGQINSVFIAPSNVLDNPSTPQQQTTGSSTGVVPAPSAANAQD